MTRRVAVIGAGPGGLVAARWLLHVGFDVTLFEQTPWVGGQWAGLPDSSGVWPGMYTNTSRVLTAFSDLPPDGQQVFPSSRAVFDYLVRYAEKFGLSGRTRFGVRVDRLHRGDGPTPHWILRHSNITEIFDHVVVASGRFQTPVIPDVPGLDGFTGSDGVGATYHYRGADRYRDKRVLVAGCAVSALEIAAELAQYGAARVVVTQRRQRYVLAKFAAGVPSDHRIFTRYQTLAAETLPTSEIDRQLKEIVIEAGGSPEQYGAPRPDPSLFAAGVTLNQNYLPLVGEGRITVRPWITAISGRTVTFGDGHSEEIDAILFGTGFRLNLPFLDQHIASVLDLDAVHMDADRHTFHPDLPGLAFMGMWDQSGGYFVPLELQARWISYTWGDVVAPPSDAESRSAIAAYRQRRGLSQKSRMNIAALTFARAAGVEPLLQAWPQLHRALLFGPLAPSSFRLEGPDAASWAPDRFASDAAAFGAITSNELTDRERAYWDLVGAAG